MVRSEHMWYVWIQNHELQVILTCIFHIEAVTMPVLAHIHKTKESVIRKLLITGYKKLNVHIVKYCILFLSSYFAHVHLQRRVHFNFAFMHLQREQVCVQVHFTSRWNTSLARGSEVHMGSSLPSSSFHP